MPETAITQVQSRLIKVGNTERAIEGFSVKVAMEHLENHLLELDAEDRWCDLSCFARTIFQRNCAANRQKTRERVGRLHVAFRDMHEKWLIVEYAGSNGAITRFKLRGNEDSPGEREALQVQLDRLRKSGELIGAKGKAAQKILQMDLGF